MAKKTTKTTKKKAPAKAKAAKTPTTATRGFVIIAAGHAYYGMYAYNLAMSLKTTAPNVPITVLHAGDGLSMLSEDALAIFDTVKQVPAKAYSVHGLPVWLKIKLWLDGLSPYDETIYIDADTICTPEKNLNNLFDMLATFKTNFTVQNRGFVELKKGFAGSNRWCDLGQAHDAYGGGKYYDIYTEFMYFKKCDEVTKLFAGAREVFAKPKIEYKNFAGAMPDEMAFAVSMLVNGIKPHAEHFLPTYWQAAENQQLTPAALHAGYFLYSVGGNHTAKQAQKVYNNLAIYYSNKFGVRFPWKMKEKRDFLPERIRI